MNRFLNLEMPLSFYFTSCHLTSHCVIISRHVTSRHVTSRHIILGYVVMLS